MALDRTSAKLKGAKLKFSSQVAQKSVHQCTIFCASVVKNLAKNLHKDRLMLPGRPVSN